VRKSGKTQQTGKAGHDTEKYVLSEGGLTGGHEDLADAVVERLHRL